jgi:hypothetical protein
MKPVKEIEGKGCNVFDDIGDGNGAIWCLRQDSKQLLRELVLASQE